MKNLLIVLFVLGALVSQAQTNLDSLYTIWEDESQSDSTRSKAFGDYIWFGYLFSNPDTAFTLAQDLLKFGDDHQYPNAKSSAYRLMGIFSSLKSDYPEALNYTQRGLKISEQIGEPILMAQAICNIGNIYRKLGDESKALDHYQRSLKISQEIEDKRMIANNITCIGVMYADQANYLQSLEYFQRSLQIHEEMGAKAISANVLGNMGQNYAKLGDDLKALEYLQRSLEINEEIGNLGASGHNIARIGLIFSEQGDYDKALSHLKRSLQIFEEIGDKVASANALTSIGNIYKDQGDYAKALENCEKSLEIGVNFSALTEEKNACQCLFDTYKAMGSGNKALVYLEMLQVIGDSLNAEETAKQLQQMEFQKQVLADSLANAEEARIVENEHKEEVRKKNKTRNALLGGGLFLFIIAGGIYSRLRYTRKAKAEIEKEKDRSENLLLNILPADIAAELKEKGRADARDFEMVTILFTDFKGFTAVSEKLSAQDLVSEINTCFEAFDGIMGKYGIEKIKTIGDAYMAAGGLPVPTDDSVKNTVLAALEMQAFIRNRKAKLDAEGKPGFEMRVGVHTGPVVAGIVGVKKFQYDIWGDTVNTASRMESSGEVGRVNISEATYKLLVSQQEVIDALEVTGSVASRASATSPQFSFESRGKIKAKGKGEMEMYFVNRSFSEG